MQVPLSPIKNIAVFLCKSKYFLHNSIYWCYFWWQKYHDQSHTEREMNFKSGFDLDLSKRSKFKHKRQILKQINCMLETAEQPLRQGQTVSDI